MKHTIFLPLMLLVATGAYAAAGQNSPHSTSWNDQSKSASAFLDNIDDIDEQLTTNLHTSPKYSPYSRNSIRTMGAQPAPLSLNAPRPRSNSSSSVGKTSPAISSPKPASSPTSVPSPLAAAILTSPANVVGNNVASPASNPAMNVQKK